MFFRSENNASEAATDTLARALIESADDAIFTFDLDGVIQTWNPGAARVFGYGTDEAVGRPATMLVPPGGRDDEAQRIARLRRGEAMTPYNAIHTTKDGGQVWLSIALSLVKDARGRALGICKIARVQAAAAEARLAAIVDSADDAIISKSLNGIIQTWNKSAERIFGYAAEEAIGQSITMIIPPERHEEEPQILARIQAGERVDHYETVRVRKDGRLIPISLTISPIKDPIGRIIGASKIARDISERKRIDALKRARISELQAVIEAVPAAVLIVEDRECRVVRTNQAGYMLLQAMGSAAAPASGPRDNTIEHGVPLAKDIANLKRAVLGEEVQQWEEKATWIDGEVRHFLGSAVPLRDENGSPRGAVAAFLDITPRIWAENALREADRRKDEFLAMLAHELRNPLTPIRTGLEIVQKNLGDQNRRDWALQVIDRQLVQLTRVIDDLLELARIANGSITLKKETTSLRTLVANAVETSRPYISARRHVLRVDLPLHEIRLHVDVVRLTQAIANLLSNAAKFTEPGGTIAVKGEIVDGELVLRVQDSGRGIDPELLPRVFDVFVQGKQSVARTEGGLGVGLSIVRRIVELHGGSVAAASKGPGRGSEFSLRLPVADEGTERAIAQADPATNSKRRRVLIVDDNRDVADTIGEFLRLHGHEVEQHYEGNGVLEKALAFQADVLVIDLGLPGRDGFDVARDVRAHPDLRRLPLIAISGYGQPADIERSREAGLNFHLLKPVDTQLLMKLIEVNVGPFTT